MDTTKTTHISLCTGYGGIDLGLRRAIPNLRTVAYAEIEAFACENLLARMEAGQLDAAPIWSDLKSFPWKEFSGLVDILSGGYPCQPFSAAGKRLGTEDPRHLWPYIADGIRVLRPRICFFENVEGHISLGLREVIGELEELGYQTTFGIFSASECGAPHQRKRVFILAHRCDTGLQGPEWIREAGTERPPSGHTSQCNGPVDVASGLGGASGLSGPFTGHEGQSGEPDDSGYKVMADAQLHGCNHAKQRPHSDGIQGPLGQEHEHGQTLGDGQLWPSRPGEQQYGWEPPRVVADSHRIDRSAQTEGREHDRQTGSAGEELGDSQSGNGKGQQLHLRQGKGEHRGASGSECSGRWQTQSPLGGNPDGTASGLDYAQLCVSGDNRTDELRLLGNGVVPATAERAFRTLIEELFPNEITTDPAPSR